MASVNLGCGRKAVHHAIDYSAGILLEKKVGDRVSKGELICTVLGEEESKVEHALRKLENSVTISAHPPIIKSKILEVID